MALECSFSSLTLFDYYTIFTSVNKAKTPWKSESLKKTKQKRLVRTNLLCEEGTTLCDERISRLLPRILDQEGLTKQTIHFLLYRFEEVFLLIVKKEFLPLLFTDGLTSKQILLLEFSVGRELVFLFLFCLLLEKELQFLASPYLKL